jgi:hypothetical protein
MTKKGGFGRFFCKKNYLSENQWVDFFSGISQSIVFRGLINGFIFNLLNIFGRQNLFGNFITLLRSIPFEKNGFYQQRFSF